MFVNTGLCFSDSFRSAIEMQRALMEMENRQLKFELDEVKRQENKLEKKVKTLAPPRISFFHVAIVGLVCAAVGYGIASSK